MSRARLAACGDDAVSCALVSSRNHNWSSVASGNLLV